MGHPEQMKSRVHPKYKNQDRVTIWHEYEQGMGETDRSSKRAVDVAFTVPGGPIFSRHSPPQQPARRAWSVLRFSEA
ncbi:MAG: hypothetical protein ACJAZN_003814, partial [Planctomycetota bacterium]